MAQVGRSSMHEDIGLAESCRRISAIESRRTRQNVVDAHVPNEARKERCH